MINPDSPNQSIQLNQSQRTKKEQRNGLMNPNSEVQSNKTTKSQSNPNTSKDNNSGLEYRESSFGQQQKPSQDSQEENQEMIKSSNVSLRHKLQERVSKRKMSSVHGSEAHSLPDSQISQMTTNKMNDKVDTKFSQMHSNFILLKEKENKLNYQFKKEEILKQKSQNLPEHIMEKYSTSSKMVSQNQTSKGLSRKHFGSISGMNRSNKTFSPDNKKFQSKIRDRIRSVFTREPDSLVQHLDRSVDDNCSDVTENVLENFNRRPNEEGNFENFESLNNLEENISNRVGGMSSAKKTVNEMDSNQKSRALYGMSPNMVSEGMLKNMSVTKMDNRFNKMITEFDNIDVNQSYLDNGFQNMKANFGDINQTSGKGSIVQDKRKEDKYSEYEMEEQPTRNMNIPGGTKGAGSNRKTNSFDPQFSSQFQKKKLTFTNRPALQGKESRPDIVKLYQKYPNIDSIKNSNFNPLKFSKEFENTKVEKREDGFYSEQVSKKDNSSVKSSHTNIPKENQRANQINVPSDAIYQDFSKRKFEKEKERIILENTNFDVKDKLHESKLVKEGFKIHPRNQDQLEHDEFQGKTANKMSLHSKSNMHSFDSQRSMVDSRLNYTENFLQLTDSNVSKLERRNRQYNVFNTYSSVKNPKNIMERRDRNKALNDLLQQESTCSSGIDITVLRSDNALGRYPLLSFPTNISSVKSKNNFQLKSQQDNYVIAFDEYGNQINPANAKKLQSQIKNPSFRGSNSSLKSRISSRIIKGDKQRVSQHHMAQDSYQTKSLIKNITSNIPPSHNLDTLEVLQKSIPHQVISTHTQHVDLNFQMANKKYQTSIESENKTQLLREAAESEMKPNLFEESKSLKTNIKITESNVQLSQSRNISKVETEKQTSSSQNPLLTDANFINALKNMKESITQIKKKGVSELKSKNDTSWMCKQETEELAVMKAGLGGDVSRVHFISNFSVISDFDRSGDTLLNLEKYLGGLSTTGQDKDKMTVSNDELPKLKFLLEKLRMVLGKDEYGEAMSKIDEEDDSQNPPPQINEIIRTNNFLINQLNHKLTPQKKNSIKSEKISLKHSNLSDQKARLPKSHPGTFTTQKEKSFKSVLEKYNIPETKTVKQKNYRVSIQSKVSNSNKNQEGSKGSRISKQNVHTSGNTVKDVKSAKKNPTKKTEKIQKQLDKWGFIRAESTEIVQQLFKKKHKKQDQFNLTLGLPSNGLEMEILNSEFNKIRTSNLSLPNSTQKTQTFRRNTFHPLLNQPDSKKLEQSLKSNASKISETLKHSFKEDSKGKPDILAKYGINSQKLITKKKRLADQQRNLRNPQSPMKANAEYNNLESSRKLNQTGENTFEYLRMQTDDTLNMDSKLPRELDKQFKKMMSMDIDPNNFQDYEDIQIMNKMPANYEKHRINLNDDLDDEKLYLEYQDQYDLYLNDPLSAKNSPLDYISEKSREYSLSSKDKINLSSKFTNQKKTNFISNNLNDSELDKIPQEFPGILNQMIKGVHSMPSGKLLNGDSYERGVLAGQYRKTETKQSLSKKLIKNQQIMREKQMRKMNTGNTGQKEKQGLKSGKQQVKTVDEYVFVRENHEKNLLTPEMSDFINEEMTSKQKHNKTILSAQEYRPNQKEQLFQSQCANPGKDSLPLHDRLNYFKHKNKNSRVLYTFNPTQDSPGTNQLDSRRSKRFSQNSFKSIENTSLYDKICQNYSKLIIKNIRNKEKRNSKLNKSLNKSVLTESEEVIIKKITHSYISKRVDAFLFENLSNNRSRLSQDDDVRSSNTRKIGVQGSESCSQTNSNFNNSAVNSMNQSTSTFKESKTFGEDNSMNRTKRTLQNTSQIIVISKKSKAKPSMSRSMISNSSCLTGMTFIQAEIAKNYLTNIVNSNINKLNESRNSHKEKNDCYVKNVSRDLTKEGRNSTVMSLENFVKNCVNNWLDDVVCSVNEEESVTNQDQNISEITETISENLILSRQRRFTEGSSYLRANNMHGSSVHMIVEEQELKGFNRSKEMFNSIAYVVKEESDIVISEEFSNGMESNQSMKNLGENSNMEQSQTRTKGIPNIESQQTVEIVRLVNTLHKKANDKISIENELKNKHNISNFLESLNEDQLLSRKVTRKNREGKELHIMSSEVQNRTKVSMDRINFSDFNLYSMNKSSFQLPPIVSRKLFESEMNSTILNSKIKKSLYLYNKSGRRESYNDQNSLNHTNEIIEGNEDSYFFYDLGLVGSNWMEYKGEYKDGLKHGYGVWLLGNGEIYEGYFENGKAHGKGKYTSKTGEVLVAFWKMNVLQHTESHKILLPEGDSDSEN